MRCIMGNLFVHRHTWSSYNTEAVFVGAAVFLCLGGAVGGLRADVCLEETFRAECYTDGEVVVMRSAHYGRMSLGRCLTVGWGVMGCVRDVLPLMDWLCSGNKACSVRTTEIQTRYGFTEPCLAQLRSYLEVEYECVQVYSGSCSEGVQRVQAHHGGVMTRQDATASRCRGGGGAVVVVEARPGQRLNITLHDFTTWSRTRGHNVTIPSNHCEKYGLVYEAGDRGSGDNWTICGDQRRERHLVTSTSHAVAVSLYPAPHHPGQKHNKTVPFLIKYTVIGCPDITSLAHAWLERDALSLVIGCDWAPVSWHLNCVGTEWKGVVGVCPGNATDLPLSGPSQTPVGPTSSWFLPVVICLSTVDCVLFCSLLAGGLHLKRKGRQQCVASSTDGATSHRERDMISGDTYRPDYEPFQFADSARRTTDPDVQSLDSSRDSASRTTDPDVQSLDSSRDSANRTTDPDVQSLDSSRDSDSPIRTAMETPLRTGSGALGPLLGVHIWETPLPDPPK